MTKAPKTYSKEFKTKVALEMIKGDKTVNEVASAYEINPSQVKRWKQKALAGMSEVFAGEGKGAEYEIKAKEELIGELYKQIGQLKYENDWVKKKLGISK
jgi:transposase-like protein